MKIKIKEHNKIGFSIYLPLFILKSHWIYQKIFKDKINISKELVNSIYYEVKKWRKKNGKLRLVDIKDSDGTIVYIQI